MLLHNMAVGDVKCCRDLNRPCVGKECAAWQIHFKTANVNKDGESVWVNTITNYGYCGVAGMPTFPMDEIKVLEEEDGE